ncbi:UNVERIFIED_CONTAM: ATP-binding cassette sub- B member 10, mitochondrial [Siphonaria sp. JEL0065]|nr:ATP-binding cassette sub- B member 10, mitochondrial [Siphonaria sp. JEL0065]
MASVPKPAQANASPNAANSLTDKEALKVEANKQKMEEKKAKAAEKAQRHRQIRRLFALAKPEISLLVGAASCLVVSSGVSMAVPFAMGKIMDYVMMKMGLEVPDSALLRFLKSIPFEHLFGGLIGVFLAGGAANFGRIVLMRKAGERIIERLRNRIFDSVIRQDIQFFDEIRAGDVVSRLSSDTIVVGKSLTQTLSDGIRKGVMCSVGVGMMFYANTKLTLTMMGIIPPVAFAAIKYGKALKRISEQTQNATSQTTLIAQEKLDAIRTVRAFSQESRESAMFAKENKRVYDLAIKEAYANAWFFGSAGFSGNCVAMAILYYGGSLVANGQITPGELTSFFMYTGYVGFSMMGIGSFFGELMKGVGASTRLFELIETKAKLAEGTQTLENVEGRIEFRNVEFAYPTRPDASVFADLSFTIQPGTNVALVGKSGAGKSTIVQLLLRFYDPKNGLVLIDGHDLRSLNATHLRDAAIAFVPQEPTLFATSIRENITYGRPTVTHEEIIAATKKANALEFIQAFPQGLDTYTGEKGVAMSGGQKQRIAIARALLKDPKILILDEATSALDAESEGLVQDAMNKIKEGRTVITIAHRLSTIQQADVVIVVEDGRVVETGKYPALIARKDGKFRQLIEAQLN